MTEPDDLEETTESSHPGGAGSGGPASEDAGDLEPAPCPGEPDPLEQARAEAAKWRELALRGQADMENYRKRMAREKSEATYYANLSLLSSLLPVLDNFEMGLQAASQEGEGNVIYQGFLMVRKQIEDFLADQGVQPVPASGPFDPNQHEAILQMHHESVPEGEIIAEIRRGYRLGERLLRAANVTISKGPAEPG